jgi:PAS domain S-box-containing protein
MHSPAILIVEDEAIVALDLSLQLADLGYAVAGVAASGEQALALVAQQAPDLILMDVRLQGQLDGIETAQRIRAERDIPVIFLTSHSDADTVQRAARTAPYGYLTKPYQLKELRAGIEVALTKSRMERQLRQADRWFAHTLRCVGDGVVVTDLDARVRFLNPAAEQLTGWSVDAALGQPVDQVVRLRPPLAPAAGGGSGQAEGSHPDAPGQLVRTVLAHGRPLPAAHGLSLLDQDGGQHLVDQTAGPVDDDGGGRLGAVLVLRDASARLAQESLLRASEERFRNAFDHAPLGMALVALGGEIMQANDALCRLLGGTAEALRRCSHHSLGLEDDRAHEQQRLHELLGGAAPGNVVQFERRYRRLDGAEPVWTLVSVSLMHEGETPTCYLYQVHDLTQQKLAAQQLAELAEERLKREASELASAARSEFLSRASHEMRTPLNAVIGFAQLLQMLKGGDPAKTETYANHIRVAGEHLLTLVTDLLDINRASQGRLRIEPQPLGLQRAVQESLELLATLGQSHGVLLAEAVPADLVVLADPTRLRQVLLNLGSNAIKYNRQGGDVRFLARRADNGRIGLSVVDSGIGMTEEQLERLFQPFDRLGLERSRIPGVGLGLVIARSLVLEMGGSLAVHSRARSGTSIHIELPAGP